MLRKITVLFLAAALSAASFADDAPSTSTLKVDLNDVVSSGVVIPVDGITAAGQPDEAALEVFAEQGYTTVIDLRMPGEDRGMDEPEVVDGLGMKYLTLPISRDSITFESAQALDTLIDEADGPVLLHCGSANRVGALLALRASLAGVDDEAALSYGREGGLTGLEPVVRQVLDDD